MEATHLQAVISAINSGFETSSRCPALAKKRPITDGQRQPPGPPLSNLLALSLGLLQQLKEALGILQLIIGWHCRRAAKLKPQLLDPLAQSQSVTLVFRPAQCFYHMRNPLLPIGRQALHKLFQVE